MGEKTICVMIFLFITCVIGGWIRQGLINQEVKNETTLLKMEVEELAKKQRIAAQDIKFYEKLIREGKN